MTEEKAQALINSLDIDQFKSEIDMLRKEEISTIDMQSELRHVKRIDLWIRIIWWAGMAVSWIMINPVAVILIGLSKSARWTMLGHHVGHGAYDKAEGVPKRFHSKYFAKGAWRRFIDWIDWMKPGAWEFEHNVLHHYHLSEPVDPDFVQKNVAFLRAKGWPVWLKYPVAFFLMATWKFMYYAPNTLWYLHHKEISNETLQKVLDEEEKLGRSFPGSRIYSPFHPVGRRYWFECLLPYLGYNFVLLPALFLPLGWQTSLIVLGNMLLAEIFTNLHTYWIVVTNHSGEDVPYFTTPIRSKAEFYFRQIAGSVNYTGGNSFLDFLHGYANYQIEHHLWPDLPLRSYRRLQPKVEALAVRYGIPYIRENVFRRVWKLTQLMVGKRSMYHLKTGGMEKAGVFDSVSEVRQ